MTDLWKLTARDMVALLKKGEVSPLEAIDAALARIEKTNGAINALPTLCPDRARDKARRLPRSGPETEARGWLAGLPIAVKDLNDVQGVRTTSGSLVYKDRVPDRSDIVVEALERHGAVVLAKSNTPEFGAGANTFNEVFGKTRNPWNTAKTSGGSSGGSAAALAAGQVWLAHGNDLGGSLRTPASFCGVVGMRPGPGVVARGPHKIPFDTLWVEGPMARNVGDLALMLDAMAGNSPEDPISIPAPAMPYQAAVGRGRPKKIAVATSIAGLPVEKEVRDAVLGAAKKIAGEGVIVEEAAPDFSGAAEIFSTLRAAMFVALIGPMLEKHRNTLKADIVWNTEEGLKLKADDIERAERERGKLFHRVATFMKSYDAFVCPTAIVPAFDVDKRFIDEVGGHKFENYFQWLGTTFAITLASSPALSLPCGFTKDGLPIGLQMMGRAQGEADLIAGAAFAESLFGLSDRVPVDPRS